MPKPKTTIKKRIPKNLEGEIDEDIIESDSDTPNIQRTIVDDVKRNTHKDDEKSDDESDDGKAEDVDDKDETESDDEEKDDKDDFEPEEIDEKENDDDKEETVKDDEKETKKDDTESVDEIEQPDEHHGDTCLYKIKNNAKVLYDEQSENLFDDENIVQTKKIVPPNERITRPILTKYERVRLLSERRKQLILGAKPMVKISDRVSEKEIALLELKSKVIPLIIVRTLPNGNIEHWKLDELEIVN
jgi:DNA-directed RNA polymerase subunit K/omega